jgi:hypothetical protein
MYIYAIALIDSFFYKPGERSPGLAKYFYTHVSLKRLDPRRALQVEQ